MDIEFESQIDVDDLRSQFTSKLAYLLGRQEALIESLDNRELEMFDFYMSQLTKVTADIDALLSAFNKQFHNIYYKD